MNPPSVTYYYESSASTQRSCSGRRNKILVGSGVKAKLGELENEVKENISRRMRKELTGVLDAVSGNRMFLVRFQDVCENNLISN